MSDPRPMSRVEVAVGLVRDSNGRYLMASRPIGKPYAGWWEFPGGKLEAGESAEACLAREFREELGLSIGSSRLLWTADHDYAHALVRLHFCLVSDWQGEPEGLEGQQVCWVRPTEGLPFPILPASRPVLSSLSRRELL